MILELRTYLYKQGANIYFKLFRNTRKENIHHMTFYVIKRCITKPGTTKVMKGIADDNFVAGVIATKLAQFIILSKS